MTALLKARLQILVLGRRLGEANARTALVAGERTAAESDREVWRERALRAEFLLEQMDGPVEEILDVEDFLARTFPTPAAARRQHPSGGGR